MKACYPYLKETKGSVINFASGAGLFGNYGQCAYAAAKEGIRGLSRVAATEWGADGINVNVVSYTHLPKALSKLTFSQVFPAAESPSCQVLLPIKQLWLITAENLLMTKNPAQVISAII